MVVPCNICRSLCQRRWVWFFIQKSPFFFQEVIFCYSLWIKESGWNDIEIRFQVPALKLTWLARKFTTFSYIGETSSKWVFFSGVWCFPGGVVTCFYCGVLPLQIVDLSFRTLSYFSWPSGVTPRSWNPEEKQDGRSCGCFSSSFFWGCYFLTGIIQWDHPFFWGDQTMKVYTYMAMLMGFPENNSGLFCVGNGNLMTAVLEGVPHHSLDHVNMPFPVR